METATLSLIGSATALSLLFLITDPRLIEKLLSSGQKKRARTGKVTRSTRQ